jgi:hypothetical protein
VAVNKNPVKVKVKFTLEQAMKTQRGSRGITLLLYNGKFMFTDFCGH